MFSKIKLLCNSHGQTSVGYVLTIAVMALGGAYILYGPVMMGLRLLYIDAATRVIGEGPDIDAQIRKAQEHVLGSSPILGGLFSAAQSKTPASPAPASRSQPRGWDNAGADANSTATNSPAIDSASSTAKPPASDASSPTVKIDGNVANASSADNMSGTMTENASAETCTETEGGGV